MKVTKDRYSDIDILSILEDLQSKYRTVYWITLDGNIYVYKPLGRRDHKELVENEELSEMDKQDEVIKRCILFPTPRDLDLDVLPAGIVEKLFETIVENSFLKDLETRSNVLQYYRSEMYDMSNQVPCLINEAFPQYDIEEIENWDVERTAKYLSRAEWKLVNLRGMTFNAEYMQQQGFEQPQEEPVPNIGKTEEITTSNQERSKIDPGSTHKKEPMTPEKLAYLQKNFPDIDWANDAVAKEGIDGFKHKDGFLGGESPALQTPHSNKAFMYK